MEDAMRDNIFSRFASAATKWTGTTAAFILATGTVVVWAVTGPIFRYSDTWQLTINTGTTIVTFLMVFLIQRKQNEIVAALEGASNRLIAVEDLSEQDLRVLHDHFERLADMAKHDRRLTESHSVEEAEARHIHKVERRKKLRESDRRIS